MQFPIPQLYVCATDALPQQLRISPAHRIPTNLDKQVLTA